MILSKQVALQKYGDTTKAHRLLHSAIKLSNHLDRIPVHTFVNNSMTGSDENNSSNAGSIPQFEKVAVPSYRILLLETMLKAAQTSFQGLLMSRGEGVGAMAHSASWKGEYFPSDSQRKETSKIKNLCQLILKLTKSMASVTGRARIILASVQLLQIQLDYVPSWCQEDLFLMKNVEDKEDDDEINDLSESVRELKMEEDYWNDERSRRLRGKATPANLKTTVSKTPGPTNTLSEERKNINYKTGGSSKCSSNSVSLESKDKTDQSNSSPILIEGSPNKRRSPKSENYNDSSMSPPKSSKHCKSQRSSKTKEKSETSVHGEKAIKGKQAGKNNSTKQMPILSIEAACSVHDNIEQEEEDATCPIPPSVKGFSRKITSKKRPLNTKRKPNTVDSPTSINKENSVTLNNTSTSVSPLSKELANLRLVSPISDAQSDNCDGNNSEHITNERRKQVKEDVTEPQKRPARRTNTRAKVSTGTGTPNVKDAKSKPTHGRREKASKAIAQSEILSELQYSFQEIQPSVADEVHVDSGLNAKQLTDGRVQQLPVVAKSKQKGGRRRKKTPEVDSPEKKRDVESPNGRPGDYSLAIDVQHQIVSSPNFLNIGCDVEGNMNYSEWMVEDPIPDHPNDMRDVLQPDSILEDESSQRRSGVFHENADSSSQLAQWSPVEIPRGRPRRVVKCDKAETPVLMSDGKQKNANGTDDGNQGSSKVKKRVSIEIALGSDEDKENFGTPDLGTSSNQSLYVKSRTGSSKLSLKKKKPSKEKKDSGKKSEKEKLAMPNRRPKTSAAKIFVWDDDDEDVEDNDDNRNEDNSSSYLIAEKLNSVTVSNEETSPTASSKQKKTRNFKSIGQKETKIVKKKESRGMEKETKKKTISYGNSPVSLNSGDDKFSAHFLTASSGQ